MREDQWFEIERSFDLLPHVVGASWAVLWFRLNKTKKPTREEFRDKVMEYFKFLFPLFDSYPNSEEFREISQYIIHRKNKEILRITKGENQEIEKRYDRYIDYG